MTVMSELKALSQTAAAKAFASASGNDLPSLVAHAEARVVELRVLLKQIAAVHRCRESGTGAFGFTALQALIDELA